MGDPTDDGALERGGRSQVLAQLSKRYRELSLRRSEEFNDCRKGIFGWWA
jgi:hypothetical protein